MRRNTTLIVSLALVLAACGGDVDAAASVEEPATTTQAAQEPTTTSQPAAQAKEAVDAKVVFDGEACSYLGPAVIPAGTEVTFEFDDSAHPAGAALVVLLVEEGTTWDQVVEASGPSFLASSVEESASAGSASVGSPSSGAQGVAFFPRFSVASDRTAISPSRPVSGASSPISHCVPLRSSRAQNSPQPCTTL